MKLYGEGCSVLQNQPNSLTLDEEIGFAIRFIKKTYEWNKDVYDNVDKATAISCIYDLVRKLLKYALTTDETTTILVGLIATAVVAEFPLPNQNGES